MTDTTTRMFNAEARDYELTRRRLVPCFDGLYAAAVRALDLTGPGPLTDVLDLGAGTGMLAGMVADAHPGARLTVLDGAPAMIEQARAIVGARIVAAHVQDLREPLPAGPWDAVVSALAIHHLRDAETADLYARVLAVLRPGGVLINAEQVLGATPALDAVVRAWHEREARALGATDAEWAASVERMRRDRCATVDAQLTMLCDAGFTDVAVHFADGRFAVLAGRRAA